MSTHTNTEFRKEVAAWLDENCPASLRGPNAFKERVWGGRNPVYANPDSKVWLDRMAAKGWTAPTWPTEYGGGGLTSAQAKILNQERIRINAPVPLLSFGLWMLGPVLLEYATEEQKKHYLPQIVKGEIRWCQGYSEPNSGSDLASLATKCEDKGDHFEVSGQKIWTSYANHADWIFCLVRTGPLHPKHDGISFVLIDMESEGVSTKPIKLISGSSPFCETFFDQVKVPKGHLVGELNKGWTIAKRLLQHERASISDMGEPPASGSGAIETIAKKRYGTNDEGQIASPAIRNRVAQLRMRASAFGHTLRRASLLGSEAGALSSMLKYTGSELNKSRLELLLEIEGLQALSQISEGEEASLSQEWLRSKGNSIEGGTSEVQLNVISKRVLGLPTA